MSVGAYPYEASPGASWSDADGDLPPDAVPYAVSLARSRPVRRRPRRGRGRLVLALAALALALGGLYGARGPQEAAREVAPAGAAPRAQRTAGATAAGQGWLLDPRPLLGAGAYGPAASLPLGPALRLAAASPDGPPQTAGEPVGAPLDPGGLAPAARPPRPSEAAPPATARAFPRTAAQIVPLPVARPSALLMQTPRLADRGALPSTRSVFQAARPPEPTFLERLFGAEPSQTPALAYADPEAGAAELTPRRRLSAVPNPSEGVAVYDITARTVTLPSGERLEAHSGLGESMDNPRHVHLRMRGSTPPAVYELTEREALFHGVRAIRLNPVGGPGAIYGRAGLLAHTYMLGATGASNGCVSFRDYNRFLQAYLRGEIRRLVVVAGGGDAPPSIGRNPIAGGRLGREDRVARTGEAT